MRALDEAEFRDFATARMAAWRRTAYLLCRDWDLAEDLVATVLGRLYRRWPHRSAIVSLDAYVSTMLVRALLDERRRPWRREHPAEFDADRDLPSPAAAEDGTVERMTLDSYLACLGERRRAVLVLRFYCDLSVEETAAALGISTGTVKSQTARGLETLRALASEHYETRRES
ncbi:sigma-70 family RNA polymerase sigma factor [Dactylosporangium sp. NPDC048998]|uniref:sigma-70 family RNA polymerase sigma factor n=1 Tax=Dactylosporangium sp. NPDC048998 TaxID=3363976 RepID=UPI0037177AF4